MVLQDEGYRYDGGENQITIGNAEGTGASLAASNLAIGIRSSYPTQSTGLNGKPFRDHASSPPTSGRTRVIPYRLRYSATRALVASFGHVQ